LAFQTKNSLLNITFHSLPSFISTEEKFKKEKLSLSMELQEGWLLSFCLLFICAICLSQETCYPIIFEMLRKF